jgi:hypothetical protein
MAAKFVAIAPQQQPALPANEPDDQDFLADFASQFEGFSSVMNNGDGLIKELHDESIQRFLNELDYPARKALADAKISISFGEGDQETVELG